MEKPRSGRRFEVLFDNAEPSPISDDAYLPYGNFGFPPALPTGRGSTPTLCSRSMASPRLLGKHGSGGEISQSPDDRWLMDLLRAHADGAPDGNEHSA